MPRLALIPYVGGKQRLVKHLLPLIPPHRVYAEVFGGAAALLLNKPPSPVEMYNDIDSELVNLLTVTRECPGRLARRAKTIPYSRELFETWRRDILAGTVPQDRVERAARYYYLMRAAFGGSFFKGWGYARGNVGKHPRSFRNQANWLKAISERLRFVYIDHLPFQRCIQNWDSPRTFFYLDPPYYGAPDKYYRFHLDDAEHDQLAEILRRTRGKWLLTYGDHPKIRRWYRRFKIRLVPTSAAVKRVPLGSKRDVKTQNLIITNYESPKGA